MKIRTPDQRLRVFVSSTLGELAPEREAVRRAIEELRLAPVMFELGARPHPPRELYRAYLDQSQVFVGIYWQQYGWVAPGESVSGLEDEYRLAGDRPRLLYLKEPAAGREQRLSELVEAFKADDLASYARFRTPQELANRVRDDLAVLLSERFETNTTPESSAGHSAPPVPPNETYGRERDIQEVIRLFEAGAPLVTLTGPGGIGKSRLALEIARAVDERFDDGPHFVPLAPVKRPELAVRTIAEVVGARAEGSQSLRSALVDRLSREPSLLVLDNVEQVIDVAADLAALLESCPQLQVLATSRQGLRIRAEQEFGVPPLPLPDPEAAFHVLQAEPAVQLFIDRAQAGGARLRLDEGNAADIAELCQRLDGLPLAIELAASRCRMLSPSDLLARLGQRLDLFEGGPDLPGRQRTLRAAIDWSHDLLGGPERRLFARLSVFEGSFTLDAAQAVCGDDIDVLEGLAGLVDRSLVAIADELVGSAPRLRMLETVRAYARERLDEARETAEFRSRHLTWYRSLANQAQPFLCGPFQRLWAHRFDPERANLRAAVATALERADDGTVIELVWDVYVFYWIRDAIDEPESWMQAVVDAGRPLDDLQVAKLHTLRTLAAISRGQYEGAKTTLEASLTEFQARGMEFEAAVALKELANVRFEVDGDPDGARAALEQSSRLFASVEHDWGVSLVESMLGTLMTSQGDLEGGRRHQLLSLDRARTIDNEPLIAQSLQQLAMVAVLDGRPDDARSLVEEAAEFLRAGRFQLATCYALDVLAAIALAQERPKVAAEAIGAAAAVRDRLGAPVWPTVRPFTQRVSEAIRERLGATAETHQFVARLDALHVLNETLAAL